MSTRGGSLITFPLPPAEPLSLLLLHSSITPKFGELVERVQVDLLCCLDVFFLLLRIRRRWIPRSVVASFLEGRGGRRGDPLEGKERKKVRGK